MHARTARRRGMTLPEVMITVAILALIAGVLVSVYLTAMRVWQRTSSQAKAFPSAYILLSQITGDLRNAAYVIVPTAPAAWVTGTSYSVGNQVSVNDVAYRCIKAHTASATNQPGTNTGQTYWGTTASWIVIYPALVDQVDSTRKAAGIYGVPITADLNHAVRYYLSDSTGSAAAVGTYLWRQQFSQTAAGVTTTLAKKMLASNITALSFERDALAVGAVNRILAIHAVAITTIGRERNTTASSQFSENVSFRNPALSTPVATPVF